MCIVKVLWSAKGFTGVSLQRNYLILCKDNVTRKNQYGCTMRSSLMSLPGTNVYGPTAIIQLWLI